MYTGNIFNSSTSSKLDMVTQYSLIIYKILFQLRYFYSSDSIFEYGCFYNFCVNCIYNEKISVFEKNSLIQ